MQNSEQELEQFTDQDDNRSLRILSGPNSTKYIIALGLAKDGSALGVVAFVLSGCAFNDLRGEFPNWG